jgi:histidine triad (HIT) family protein
MDNCIFCKIVSGEVPSYKIYEDEAYLAFIDIHPQTPGHVQLIPKKHYRWVWDMPNVGEYFELAKKIALAQRKAFGTDFVLSKTVGDEVHHAHIWIFPSNEAKGDKNDFAGNAEKLRDALA